METLKSVESKLDYNYYQLKLTRMMLKVRESSQSKLKYHRRNVNREISYTHDYMNDSKNDSFTTSKSRFNEVESFSRIKKVFIGEAKLTSNRLEKNTDEIKKLLTDIVNLKKEITKLWNIKHSLNKTSQKTSQKSAEDISNLSSRIRKSFQLFSEAVNNMVNGKNISSSNSSSKDVTSDINLDKVS